MRNIQMSIAEFMNFKELADRLNILFDHSVKHSQVTVQAKDEDLLELGF